MASTNFEPVLTYILDLDSILAMKVFFVIF